MHHYWELTDWRREPTWNHTTGSKPLADEAGTVLGARRQGWVVLIYFSQLRPDSIQCGAGNISQCLTRQRVWLRHMPIAANVSFALGRIIIIIPFLPGGWGLVGKSPFPHLVWPDTPQNPWFSHYVGLTTLSKGHASITMLSTRSWPRLSIIFSPFLKPELQRNSKEFFIFFRVPRCRCIQNENVERVQSYKYLCINDPSYCFDFAHILSLNTNEY